MNKNTNNEHTYITCNIVDTFFIVFFFDNTKQIVNNSTINNQVI